MRIYTCYWCHEGKHEKCDLSSYCSPGQYGGSRCICPCKGDPKWQEKFFESMRPLFEQLFGDWGKPKKTVEPRPDEITGSD